MSMDGSGQILGRSSVLHVGNGRCNELGRTPGDDLYAKQSVRLLVSHDFHQSVGCPGSQSPAIGSQWKSARAGGNVSLLGLSFAQSDARDLRVDEMTPGTMP